MECGLYSRVIEQVTCYGVNILCVRESPDLFSGGMCMSQIRSGMLAIFMWYVHVLCQTKWRRNMHCLYSCDMG